MQCAQIEIMCRRENTGGGGCSWLRFFHPLQTFLETRELNKMNHDKSQGYPIHYRAPKQSKEIFAKVASLVTAK